MAERYVEFLDEDEKDDLIGTANTFDTWRQIGWDNEWISLGYHVTEVLSDGHFLKYALETI